MKREKEENWKKRKSEKEEKGKRGKVEKRKRGKVNSQISMSGLSNFHFSLWDACLMFICLNVGLMWEAFWRIVECYIHEF